MPLEDWAATKETLHRFLQIVGKIRLASAPRRNHWWNVPFHLTGRGITTRPMGVDPIFAIDFDFVDHRLLVTSVTGRAASLALTDHSVASFYESTLKLLGDLGVAMIGYGIAIVIGAWLAASGAISSSVRRSITPFIRDRAVLYPILLFIVLMVFVWSPTEGTRRLIPSLLLIVLLVAGAEALRAQARKEFPDATLDALADRPEDGTAR